MRLKQNSNTAVIVKKSWASLEAIRMFLQDSPAAEQSPDDCHTIFARVLDDTDERGLWVELNTKKHREDAGAELQAMMIPWREVLAVVVGNDFSRIEKNC